MGGVAADRSMQDGVVYHENKLIPGAKEMVAWLQKEGKEFLFLTNSSDKTPKDLKYKLSSFGIHVRVALLLLLLLVVRLACARVEFATLTPGGQVEEKNFYTSALSTANVLSKQKPHGTAYVIGDAGILNALYNEGTRTTDSSLLLVSCRASEHTANVSVCGHCIRTRAGYTITDISPDYVVVGETKNYNIDRMERAINLVRYTLLLFLLPPFFP
jgi:NagD protein